MSIQNNRDRNKSNDRLSNNSLGFNRGRTLQNIDMMS